MNTFLTLPVGDTDTIVIFKLLTRPGHMNSQSLSDRTLDRDDLGYGRLDKGVSRSSGTFTKNFFFLFLFNWKSKSRPTYYKWEHLYWYWDTVPIPINRLGHPLWYRVIRPVEWNPCDNRSKDLKHCLPRTSNKSGPHWRWHYVWKFYYVGF